MRLLSFRSSARTGGAIVNAGTRIDWCHVESSASNTSALAAFALFRNTNSVFSCTGSSYSRVVEIGNNSTLFNCRVSGVAGSSGNRNGIVYNGSNALATIVRCTVLDCGGKGISTSSTNVAQAFVIRSCVVYGVDGDGIEGASTASQTIDITVAQNVIVQCGGWGIDGQSAARISAVYNRMRDNTSGNVTGLGDGLEVASETTAGTDADEFVNSGSGDFRIKNSSSYWGLGYGVADEAPASSGGGFKAVGYIGS
jgi:hypothetical protein